MASLPTPKVFGAGDPRELLDVAAGGVEPHDVLRAEPLGRARLVLVLGEDRHLCGGKERAQARDRAEADDRRAGHEHGRAVGRRRAEEPVNRDRQRLVERDRQIGDALGKGMKHRGVGDDLLGPTAAQPVRHSEHEPRREDLGREVVAGAGRAGRALLAGRIDLAAPRTRSSGRWRRACRPSPGSRDRPRSRRRPPRGRAAWVSARTVRGAASARSSRGTNADRCRRCRRRGL